MRTKTVADRIAPLALAAAVITVASPPVALAAGGVETGILTCQNVKGSGRTLIIHSTTDIRCVFRSTDGKVVQNYKGESGIGLGVDLNWNPKDKIGYTVVTASGDISQDNYFLAGKYAGGKANVTLGIGGGAQALVGGLNDSVGLKPIALEGSRGFRLAGGLAYLYLEAAR
ncbi:MAG: DUF992 domain-containing protein [Alphaproteobacteria bacterium]|nr:DUF992 domain-containing protein [Alphaproteobacteria bacterium]